MVEKVRQMTTSVCGDLGADHFLLRKGGSDWRVEPDDLDDAVAGPEESIRDVLAPPAAGVGDVVAPAKAGVLICMHGCGELTPMIEEPLGLSDEVTVESSADEPDRLRHGGAWLDSSSGWVWEADARGHYGADEEEQEGAHRIG